MGGPGDVGWRWTKTAYGCVDGDGGRAKNLGAERSEGAKGVSEPQKCGSTENGK